MNLAAVIAGNIQTKAARLLRQQTQDVLAQFDLTPMDWSMITSLAETRNGLRHAEVAEALHVKAPLVTVMSQMLEKRGIIRSIQNQFDARAKLLAVTPQGKKLLRTVETALNKRFRELLAGTSDHDAEAYSKILAAIISNNDALQAKYSHK